jgi:ribosomal-protein-alanine N-acetyltransferase
MSRRTQKINTAVLEKPSIRRQAEFLDASRRSVKLHRRWVKPPSTVDEYLQLLRRARAANRFSHFVCGPAGDLAGVINVNEVVRGAFDSGYLGFYAFVPHAGHGLMRAGLGLVIENAFRSYGLHRLEANVQPDNVRSQGLVHSLGFRLEGYSPRYLRIAGRWRDHERWALTIEDWKVTRKRTS